LARDMIYSEQYMDFVKCRIFRQTLLCRKDVPLQRNLDSALVRGFRVRVVGYEQQKMPTDHPAAIAAVEAMRSAWPAKLTFDELLDAVRSRVGEEPGDDGFLADIVMACFACGIFQLYKDPPRFTLSPGEFPRASAVARMRAHLTHVTNLNHEIVAIEDDMGAKLLTLLDGTRDRAAILAEMRAAGAAEAEPEHVDRGIEQLARMALLEA
jgi:hypothetical protein